MKVFVLILAALMGLPVFALQSKGEINCFFLYQTPDGTYTMTDTKAVNIKWGHKAVYTLDSQDSVASVNVYTEIRDTPFDHAWMAITYKDAAGTKDFSARATLKPDDSNRNQANLVLETSVTKMVVNGLEVDKYFASCLITNDPPP